jgi:hypothetical protein
MGMPESVDMTALVVPFDVTGHGPMSITAGMLEGKKCIVKCPDLRS